MCNPISFEPIKFNLPSIINFDVDAKIPSRLDEGVWETPIVYRTPIIPSLISITVPDVPKISINIPFGEPPQISCVCLIRDPGTTDQQWLDAKKRVGMHVSTEEKCQAILQHILKPMNLDEPFEKFIDGLYESLQKERTDLL